jgi:lupus La protein
MANEQTVEDKILEQVEFYFSDSNLPKDKFLLEQTKKSPEGWVPVSVIASFKRIQALSPQLSTVVNALKGSAELLEVKDDGENPPMVRRKLALPENLNQVTKKRSIYAKKFPLDASVDSVKTFFAPYGKVLSVRLRYYMSDKKRKPKGSAIVEFSTEAEAAAVLHQKLKVGDADLHIQTLESWEQEKKQEAEEKKKKRKDAPKPETDEAEEEDSEEKKDLPNGYLSDSVVKIESIKSEGVSREDIMAAFKGINIETRFVDFNRGQTEAFVRLTTGGAAAAAQALSDKALELGGQRVVVHAITEAEANEYFTKVHEARQQKGGKGRKGGKGGKKQNQKNKGKGGARQKGGKANGAGPDAKKRKVEEAAGGASASSSSSSA